MKDGVTWNEKSAPDEKRHERNFHKSVQNGKFPEISIWALALLFKAKKAPHGEEIAIQIE